MPGGKTRAQWEQQAKEIERLTAELKAKTIEVEDMKSTCEFLHETEADNERLQARVEELEDIIRRALAVPPNWGSEVYEIEDILKEAATEQEGETS